MIRVKELRETKGIQQKELAIDLGVTQPTISDWESGRKVPSARNTQKLADYFGVSTDYLLGREEQKERAAIDVIDDDLREYLDELRSRPEKKMLFSVTKNATKGQIEAIVKMIEEMQGNK